MSPATGIRPDLESLILLAASLVLAVLLVESAGLVAALPADFAWVVAMPTVAVALGAIARNRNMHCLHMVVAATVLGSIGMLAGARLDFGQFGLAALADWCSTLPPLGLDGIAGRFAPASGTYLGMFVGCNLGMALSVAALRRAAAPGSALMTRVAFCNAGMAVGMVMAEAMLSASLSEFTAIRAPMRMFIVMALGMTAGMYGGWCLAELALRRRHPRRRLAALQRVSALRN